MPLKINALLMLVNERILFKHLVTQENGSPVALLLLESFHCQRIAAWDCSYVHGWLVFKLNTSELIWLAIRIFVGLKIGFESNIFIKSSFYKQLLDVGTPMGKIINIQN